MTAKLPPKWVPINLMQLNETQLRHVQAYAETFALQAVREALERAEDAVDSLHPKCTPDECSAAIRALLKEYE